MKDQIKQRWSGMEMQKTQFLSNLEGWSEEELHWAPEGEWNAIQIADHIMTSEYGTLGYLMKKTQAPASDIPVAGSDSAEGSSGLNEALKSDKQWKAPPVLPDPKDEMNFNEMAGKWSHIRGKMRSFLDELNEDYYDKQIFRHPFAGRMNLEQTLGFLEHHIEHHVHQLNRLKERM
ncbi:DinB family protein [Sanyastnella coralliicola]|uniref:DinB family protein n=1 Tax=Sanyastnella coralliicola TaxID=3069118 RepID=UPI0027BA305B|nr:DinB family protein [Longitalea sp. SCSIO 12813]